MPSKTQRQWQLHEFSPRFTVITSNIRTVFRFWHTSHEFLRRGFFLGETSRSTIICAHFPIGIYDFDLRTVEHLSCKKAAVRIEGGFGRRWGQRNCIRRRKINAFQMHFCERVGERWGISKSLHAGVYMHFFVVCCSICECGRSRWPFANVY